MLFALTHACCNLQLICLLISEFFLSLPLTTVFSVAPSGFGSCWLSPPLPCFVMSTNMFESSFLPRILEKFCFILYFTFFCLELFNVFYTFFRRGHSLWSRRDTDIDDNEDDDFTVSISFY